MKQIAAQFRSRVPALLVAALVVLGPAVRGQDPVTEDRLKILTDPESVKQKIDKDKSKPPIEFFRSQVAPFDILPYMKANHWSTLSLEMRANYDDYEGFLRTSPVRLLGMPREGGTALDAPQEVVYTRDARLIKEQRARLSMQFMLPRIPKEMNVELLKGEAVRPDEIWQASLRTLEPHQMLVLVLTRDPNDPYARWNQLHALMPMATDRTDTQSLERLRYYRLVLPLDLEHLPVSSHPLTWSTMSHVIWDGMAPEKLQPQQQQALLDWLQWGGQLTLVGGAQPSFAALKDSFLGPYLPADLSGENATLAEKDLVPLSNTYPPVVTSAEREDVNPIPNPEDRTKTFLGFVYKAPEPIRPGSNRPLFCAGLKPRAGASVIPLGEGSPHLLGVEQRVGRGRILMLSVNLTDPALSAWTGLDTLVRRVVLRRPEDNPGGMGGWSGGEYRPPGFLPLAGPDLSWFRYASRDLGASLPRLNAEYQPLSPNSGPTATLPPSPGEPSSNPIITQNSAVSEWVDSSALPRLSRDILEEASGITVPSSKFVLKVILAYVLALVPLNYLVCRYLLRRREWAWVVVPTLALGFAIGVERAAAYDVGYDAACDEINVLEMQGGYPRAHLSRFASLYTTGRVQFDISYPNDPSALALPQDNGRSLRGEDVATSRWHSQPVPTLEGLQVQPRSLSLFRAEQMVNLPGSITLDTSQSPPKIVNGTDLELRDAVLIDVGHPDKRKETYLGTIGPGAQVEAKAVPGPEKDPFEKLQPNPKSVIEALREYYEDRPENTGELRLVAWCTTTWGGQKIEPAVDRQRGVSVVLVHLKNGPPPAPDGPRFNFMVRDMAHAMKTVPPVVEPSNANGAAGVMGVMPGASMGGPASTTNTPGAKPVTPGLPDRAGVIPPSPRRVAR
ncbi:hypothetical protein [Singulisphaera sp. PoT]|uniref:hypothetical protein n=1 Tax=Singulisphaera sp. PoT TaxID=3411797 RepID=UPI003BF5064D